jgi:hypothetical protein
MKEVPEFHFIDSEHIHFMEPSMGADCFEEEKKVQGVEEFYEFPKGEDTQVKTPKIKKNRKLSTKNTPEDSNQHAMAKSKEKKYKCLQNDREKNPNQLFGHWSIEENKKYHWFL